MAADRSYTMLQDDAGVQHEELPAFVRRLAACGLHAAGDPLLQRPVVGSTKVLMFPQPPTAPARWLSIPRSTKDREDESSGGSAG